VSQDAMAAVGTAAAPRRIVSCDEEAWVQDRIAGAIDMAIALHKERSVGASDPAYKSGVRGVVEGAAWEIIRTLGLEPACINIRHPYPNSGYGQAQNVAAGLGSALTKQR
jgi:hypothetical protein